MSRSIGNETFPELTKVPTPLPSPIPTFVSSRRRLDTDNNTGAVITAAAHDNLLRLLLCC